MLIKATRPNPNSIAEDEKFEITYSLDFPSQQKKVRYTKIHTLGVSSLCGLATIAEYIIRRPFRERMAIYKNILKYAHRKNPANPANPANPQSKLDAIDPIYFLLVEQFQEARNEALKKFIKNDISSIRTNLSSAGAVSDSVSASVLARNINDMNVAQMTKIQSSLKELNEMDAKLYQSTFGDAANKQHFDLINFDEFKKLFQVKSTSEIFEFANERANILKGAEGVESQTVSFFTAYFNKDNSCQLWIINLLQNYEQKVNESLTSVLKVEEDDEINQGEDYSFDHLQLFFKLAINQAIDHVLPFNPFELHDPDDVVQQKYKRRILNIKKQTNAFSIFPPGHEDPNADYNISCFFTGGTGEEGAGHYSYSQRQGEEKFPQPAQEELARIVAPEGSAARVPASVLAVSGARAPAPGGLGASLMASLRAKAVGNQGSSEGSGRVVLGSLRHASTNQKLVAIKTEDIDPTYDFNSQFKYVETTGYKNYCAYGSIANYVKFLSVDKRMDFYKKLFKDTGENNAANRLKIFDDKGDITDESRDELLILEIFLTLRENATSSSDHRGLAAHDESLYEKATETYQKKFPTKDFTDLDYNGFIKKYKIVDEQDINFKSKRQHSYQIWIAEFLRNKLKDPNRNLRLNLQEIEDGTQQKMSLTNLFTDQKRALFNFYFPEESNATCNAITNSDTKITNPEVANKDLFWFHKSIIEAKDGSECEENKKLFYEVYDYFLTKYKLAGDSQTAKYKHFYKKENYDTFLQTAVNIDTIVSELAKGEERPDLSPAIVKAINDDQAKVQNFLLKISEHFCREFSFEKQFLNLLHSDTFLTHATGIHYTTMVPEYKFNNPFPDNNSNLGVEAQLQLRDTLRDTQQIEIQKKNVEEAFKSAKIDSPTLGQEIFSTPHNRPSSTLINSYHSISFERLHGRQNNNYSFVEENRDGQLKSTFVKINSIIESLKTKIDINLDDKELAMAIFLSKKFGGIGTKIKEIENHYGNNSNIFDYLQQEGRLSKFIKFSYQFQQDCKSQGIYSGNEKLTENDKKKYGLRLAFIPDEIFRFHLNKLPKESETKKFILKEVNTRPTRQVNSL